MDRVLAGYVRALRAAGAEVSTAETMDAVRAVALLGYAHRADLKTALGLALAKSTADQPVHERVFELYFSVPATDPAHTDDATSAHLQAALSRAAASAEADQVQLFTQAPALTQRILRALDASAADPQQAPGAQLPDHAGDAAGAALQRAARAHVDRAFELYGRPATENFMAAVAVQKPLAQMGSRAPADLERVQAAVARMARKLAARHARRQRVQRRGRLDLRRTLRANAGHGGVPFTLAFKHRRRDKPRVVVVCDVSGSVAAQVRFLLLFLVALHGEFGGVLGDLRSFAFSSQLQEVSQTLEQLPFDDAMALILKEVGMGSTDYGRAFSDLHRLLQRQPQLVDRRTTLLVLGDGRSNGSNPRLDLFAELAERAKRVVWLCPEAPGRWGSGDSAMLLYRPLCSAVAHCATATDLERVLDEALAAYH